MALTYRKIHQNRKEGLGYRDRYGVPCNDDEKRHHLAPLDRDFVEKKEKMKMSSIRVDSQWNQAILAEMGTEKIPFNLHDGKLLRYRIGHDQLRFRFAVMPHFGLPLHDFTDKPDFLSFYEEAEKNGLAPVFVFDCDCENVSNVEFSWYGYLRLDYCEISAFQEKNGRFHLSLLETLNPSFSDFFFTADAIHFTPITCLLVPRGVSSADAADEAEFQGLIPSFE